VEAPVCDDGAAPADHGANDPSATSSATIEKRTRFMEFLLRSGCTAITRTLASENHRTRRRRNASTSNHSDTRGRYGHSVGDACSRSRYACHSSGTSAFLLVLHSLQAGTTLPRVDRPPRPSGT